MFQILKYLYFLVQAVQPVIVPICFVTAWALVFLVLRSTWMTARNGVATVKRLHQIPCADCQFFTGDYHLKCTIRPTSALTEEAIDCSDFYPLDRPDLIRKYH